MDDTPDDREAEDAVFAEWLAAQENDVMLLNYAPPSVRSPLTELGDMLVELLFIGGFISGLLLNLVSTCRIFVHSFGRTPLLGLCSEVLALIAFVAMIATVVTSGRRTRKRWAALWIFLGVTMLLLCVACYI